MVSTFDPILALADDAASALQCPQEPRWWRVASESRLPVSKLAQTERGAVGRGSGFYGVRNFQTIFHFRGV